MTGFTKDAVQSRIHAISANPDELVEYSLPALQAIWKALHPRKKPPHLKTLLIREIAYRIQSKQQGDIDQRSLNALQTAKTNYYRPQTANSKPTKDKNKKPTASKASNLLTDGMVLKRQFNGRLYEATVMIRDDKQRFLFNQHEYKSLSKIAKEITGAHWSGPRFFGLTKLKGEKIRELSSELEQEDFYSNESGKERLLNPFKITHQSEITEDESSQTTRLDIEIKRHDGKRWILSKDGKPMVIACQKS